MILEPDIFHLPDFNLRLSESKKLDGMFASVMRSELLHTLFASTKTEVSRIWAVQLTGLKHNPKLNLVISKNNLGDFKTTSAITQKQFEAQLDQYDYDRQTSFYLDGFGVISFMVIGVQVYPSFKIFQKIHHMDSSFLKKGRRKYRFLMQKLVEQNGLSISLAQAS